MKIDIKTRKELKESLRILEKRVAYAKKNFFSGLKQKSLFEVINNNLVDKGMRGVI
tara:strand:+ start:122 stop:289 length:168 start_codon:yes stop_codon:yes gene_type:complete